MVTMDRKQIEQGISEMEVYKKTTDKLKRAGLVIPPKPQDAVQGIDLFSEWENLKKKYGGVANIPYPELGEFLDRWTSMIAYARWTEAVADIDQQSAREIRDTVQKQLYTIQDGGREIRAAMVATEPIYIKWENEFTEKVALYTAIRGLREGYEQRANAISREITRRGSDNLDTRRGINRGMNA